MGIVGHSVYCIAILLALSAPARAGDFQFLTSSFLGGPGGADRVVGARIRSGGTIILAADLSPDFATGSAKVFGNADRRGCVLRLSADGRKLLSIFRVADEVKDLSIDAQDNLYLAAGKAGLVKLNPAADRILWSQSAGDSCDRADAGRDGCSVALVASGRNAGTILILDPAGKQVGSAKGRNFTNDVCIDSASKTVVFVGFRNARANDGKRVEPVQIAYVQAIGYDGTAKWCDYDWSTDQKSDRFVNRSGNNMADTRAYRCAVGRDGKLYVGFEAAGGNHIFRYSPTDITAKANLAGGDAYHSFHASAAEHKTIVCRFDPATGAFLAGQQWCGRRANGRANAARMKDGDITADEDGRVCLAGVVGESIPVDLDPLPGSSKSGAYCLVLSPDMKQRVLCTRTAGGKGSAHCADVRSVNGRTIAVYAGGSMESGMYTLEPLQKEAGGKTGFVAVLESRR